MPRTATPNLIRIIELPSSSADRFGDRGASVEEVHPGALCGTALEDVTNHFSNILAAGRGDLSIVGFDDANSPAG